MGRTHAAKPRCDLKIKKLITNLEIMNIFLSGCEREKEDPAERQTHVTLCLQMCGRNRLCVVVVPPCVLCVTLPYSSLVCVCVCVEELG